MPGLPLASSIMTADGLLPDGDRPEEDSAPPASVMPTVIVHPQLQDRDFEVPSPYP